MATGMIPSEHDSGIGFGTTVDLTNNTDYTCTSDGIFRVNVPASSNQVYSLGYVNGTLLITATACAYSGTASSIAVKKGMTIKAVFAGSGNGKFYPYT